MNLFEIIMQSMVYSKSTILLADCHSGIILAIVYTLTQTLSKTWWSRNRPQNRPKTWKTRCLIKWISLTLLFWVSHYSHLGSRGHSFLHLLFVCELLLPASFWSKMTWVQIFVEHKSSYTNYHLEIAWGKIPALWPISVKHKTEQSISGREQ